MQWRHDQLSTFGIGADRSVTEWRSVLRQAVAAQYVWVDADEYNALKLTELARPILKGEKTVLLRQYQKPERKRKEKSQAKFSQLALPPHEQKLFEKLRWWRMEIAREQNMPAYVIFQDATLREIALAKPVTVEELKHISGIGDKRLNQWGEDIIRLVSEFSVSV